MSSLNTEGELAIDLMLSCVVPSNNAILDVIVREKILVMGFRLLGKHVDKGVGVW